MYHKSGLPWTRYWDFILLDIAAMFVSQIVAYYIYIPTDFQLSGSPEYLMLLFGLPLLDFVTIVVFGTMEGVLQRGYLRELAATARNTTIIFSAEAVVFFVVKMADFYSRKNFGYAIVVYFLLSYSVRVSYKWYYQKRVIPNKGRSLLVIAGGEDLPELNRQLNQGYYNAYRMAGMILADGEKKDCPLEIVADYEDADNWIRKNWVDEVLILLPPEPGVLSLANAIASMGITVHIGINYIHNMVGEGKKTVEQLGGYDVLTVYWNRISFLSSALKRMMDIAGALVGCLITLLVTLVIGPAIYLASPGPVFYAQERIGRNGKVFKMYKFRSMYPNADALKEKYMEENRVSGGFMFKLDWDPRIIGNKVLPDGTKKTGIGEFIRKTSLDEFPQFLNVLKGDMSLVGTRPPTKDEWVRYEDHHRARMAMRPGITGMWQVSGRSNITDFEEVVRLDTQYINQWSLGLDIKILCKTVLAVLKHEGSM